MSANGQDEHASELRLERFRVRDFRSFRESEVAVEADETVLVGRNDVGKTSLLEALNVYGAIAQRGFERAARDPELSEGAEPTTFSAWWRHVATDTCYEHHVLCDPKSPLETLIWGEHECTWHPRTRKLECDGTSYGARGIQRFSALGTVSQADWRTESDVPDDISDCLLVASQFATPTPYLFQPFGLALPVPLDMERVQSNGMGWAMLLQDLINRRDQTIERLELATRPLFPHFEQLGVTEERYVLTKEVVGLDEEALAGVESEAMDGERFLERFAKGQSERRVRFKVSCPGAGQLIPDTRWVPASRVSTGLLLYLAHLTVAMHAPKGSLLAIEEPENGLNPTIVLHMMHQFLEIVRDRNLQLIMTTHNPFWLDLVEPRCIRVVTRDESGSHVHADEENLQRIKDDDYYLSEVMGVSGPEALLRKRGEAS